MTVDTLVRPKEATPEWLTTVLQIAGVLPTGHVESIDQFDTPRIGATLSRLSLHYSSDAPSSAPRRLFLKIGGRTKEVPLYVDILSEMPNAPAPCCFHASRDWGDLGHRLLLDIEETHMSVDGLVPPARAYFEGAVETLAAVHAFWWDHPRLNEFDLIAGDINGFVAGQAAAALPRFIDTLSDRLGSERRNSIEAVVTSWPTIAARRDARGWGRTVIHGDAHMGNVAFPRDPIQGRILLVDWEDWRVTQGTIDLSFLIVSGCYGEYRRRIEETLLRRYHESLVKHGIAGYSWADCWEDYRRSILFTMHFLLFWFSRDQDPKYWWPAFEMLMQAFDDLGLRELVQ